MIPGERLDDRLELEQPIGTGGMGTVYRARDPISGETVAVKVISDAQNHRTERFAREIKVLVERAHDRGDQLPADRAIVAARRWCARHRRAVWGAACATRRSRNSSIARWAAMVRIQVDGRAEPPGANEPSRRNTFRNVSWAASSMVARPAQ